MFATKLQPFQAARRAALLSSIGLAICVALSRAPCLAAAAELGFSDTPPASGPVIKTARGYMVPYTATIPGTDVKFEMTPIPGGKFKLGSPAGEVKREAVEGPQVDVEVAPFWIGKYEVTWTEYERYMDAYKPFKDMEAMRNILSFDEATLSIPEDKKAVREKLKPIFDKVRKDDAAFAKLSANERQQVATLLLFAKQRDVLKVELAKAEYAALAKQLGAKQELNGVDAVTAPTKLYSPDQTYTDVEDKRQPAVTMTHFAARQYTKWLSKLTGQTYRLPSEAEWEYACRAGTTTAFSFGDDPKQLGDFAWTFENSDEKSHVVGQKKPNAWGLYDMHGNAAEWVLDELVTDHYKTLGGGVKPAWSTVVWPTKIYPRVIRGGGWDSDPDRCRSAARTGSKSDEDWKVEDPNRPLSPWWYTEDPARAVGMRVVRQVEPLSADDAKRCWDADVAEVINDTNNRIKVNNRGVVESVNQSLPGLFKQVEKLNVELESLKKKIVGDEESPQ